MPDVLQSSLREKFSSVIWKVELDESEDLVAIETRDKNTHSAAFSSFNYADGTCYFKEQSTANSWWWGLDRIHQGNILLHGYKSEGSPEHSGIIAWDAKSGETKWQRFNYALDNISDQGLIVYNPLIQFSKPELLSPETGEPMAEMPGNRILKRSIQFPDQVRDLSSLPEFIPPGAVEPFLCLNYEEKECWAFHIRTAEGFTQRLVITRNKEIILSDNLAEGIQKLNPEAFFIRKRYLFCIRNNNCEITSYLLS